MLNPQWGQYIPLYKRFLLCDKEHSQFGQIHVKTEMMYEVIAKMIAKNINKVDCILKSNAIQANIFRVREIRRYTMGLLMSYLLYVSCMDNKKLLN